MKKLIIGAALIAGMSLASTSCGGGEQKEVNNDTIVTREFTDSLSRALGAFMGANGQNEVRNIANIDDYIKGYQLVAGQKLSYEEIMGMHAGLFAAEQFFNMDNQGVEVNRDLYLQEFRKNIQNKDLTQEEFTKLYNDFQRMINILDQMLLKREQMRAGVVEEVAVEEEAVVEPDSLEELLDIEAVSENGENESISEEIDNTVL